MVEAKARQGCRRESFVTGRWLGSFFFPLAGPGVGKEITDSACKSARELGARVAVSFGAV